MKTKKFIVSGNWTLNGQKLPLFVREIQVFYDAKSYRLKLIPFHSTVFDHLRQSLNGISLTAEGTAPFSVEVEGSNISLPITNGKLGNALQALIDNKHIDLKTGEAILKYHHQLHKPTYLQQCANLCSDYELISDEPPPPSFKLVARCT